MSERKAKAARRAARAALPARSVRRLLSGGRLWWILGGIVLSAIVVVGILVARDTGAAQPVLQRGGDSVSISGTDPITGQEVSLADYAGTPVVINVWGSWCPGCAVEAEDLRRFAEDHSEVQLVGVDLQDSKSAARGFYQRYGWTHPSIFDPDGAISFSLGLQGTPTTFFLDREHRIVSRIVGETDYAGFVRGLEDALATP